MPYRDRPSPKLPQRVEWPTVALILAGYAGWAAGLFLSPSALAVPWLALTIALHASLQHEVIHGHPTPNARLNAALVWPALTLVVPYGRFRDTHLAHHRDATLTDPYEDPESNYLDPARWSRLPAALRAVLRLNNTLAGRILIGPLVGTAIFLARDAGAIARGDRDALRAWRDHVAPLTAVLAVVLLTPQPLWCYGAAVYAALGLLRIRTFLEHRAYATARARTVIIEDRGPLAFLFLNNNFHVVHHMHPQVPWYLLPATYHANADRYLKRNDGYRFGSYGEVFRRYLFRAKDPVAHPLMASPPAETARPTG